MSHDLSVALVLVRCCIRRHENAVSGIRQWLLKLLMVILALGTSHMPLIFPLCAGMKEPQGFCLLLHW